MKSFTITVEELRNPRKEILTAYNRFLELSGSSAHVIGLNKYEAFYIAVKELLEHDQED